ncbi:polysaccharide biosynthesis protein [Vitreoscilla massiliensis]|uniref:Polysaccharide biosynthesis protein n=1 Tax=Vitreoscilla massiliensis TaxID=1689272 RepID=A0ABY4E4B7_9NEIS|nr:nucleoside-diphosphate sugar epimerase/dehydratase [Vitreoscilla massiliensis]UOO90593.1 polysaccharide biosynthesis protein [Vitreoscilla massiliensis]
MRYDAILALPRSTKKAIFIIHDMIMIAVAFWFAYLVRFTFNSATLHDSNNWLVLGITTVFTLVAFVKLGLYRAVIRYVGTKMMLICLLGSMASVLVLVLVAFFTRFNLPRSIPILYFFVLLVGTISSRLAIREWIRGSFLSKNTPVIIYGAGQSGTQLLEAIRQVENFYAVAFVDDDKKHQGTIVNNLTVYSPEKLAKLVEKYEVEKILLAIPSASREDRKRILNTLEPLNLEVLSIPGMRELVEGKITVQGLKKVSVIDLLGRDPVTPIPELMQANITDKVVMVTGAGGSIGSELCRQIVELRPHTLILFELSEFLLYSIEKELREHMTQTGLNLQLIPLLGSVQQRKRLFTVMQTYQVQTIYHAAAYKHVPMVEFNTIEGVRNNVYGTLRCALAAIDAKVETFVLISTDKAVRPTNTMGASKRMAELVLQALAARSDHHTRFCMVRFGNVLGSSGSVVPVFEKQIAHGGPITLTHKDITRYFMTIPEAAQLVIQAGAMGKGGDVFVLDMGESVKIIDLAKQMIRLSGLEIQDENHPKGDIAIKITGLRPGEKLYEELLIGDNVTQTTHTRIMTANEIMLPWPELEALLARLDDACKDSDYRLVRELLLEAPTAFHPADPLCDLIWQRQVQQQTERPHKSA